MPSLTVDYKCEGNFDRVNAMWLWIECYWIVGVVLCISIGTFLFVTQHQQNEKIKDITYCLITIGSVVCIVFFLFYLLLLKDNTLWWIGWVISVLGVIISIPFCYLSVRY